jgi:hypothetical protein
MIQETVNTKPSNLKSTDGKNIIVPIIDKLEHPIFNSMLNWEVIREINDKIDPFLIKEMIDSQLYNNNLTKKEKKPAIAILDRMIYNNINAHIPKALKLKNKLDKIRQCLGYIVKVIMNVNGLEKVKCIEYQGGIIIHHGTFYI